MNTRPDEELDPRTLLAAPAVQPQRAGGPAHSRIIIVPDAEHRAAAMQARITADRIGLPPIGQRLRNVHGMEFEVQGYYQGSTEDLFYRRLPDRVAPRRLPRQANAGGPAPLQIPEDPTTGFQGDDLFPMLLPLNLSSRSQELVADTDLCTPKRFLILDTCPWVRRRQHLRYSHSIDHTSGTDLIPMFVDGQELEETILAHETGHAYVDFVLGIEDHRMYRDLRDRPAHFQVRSVQSAILDLVVNRTLQERGFSLGVIAEHLVDALYCAAAALRRGYRPPTLYEEAWLALSRAGLLFAPQLYEFAPDQRARLGAACAIFAQEAGPIERLAIRLAAAVQEAGWASTTQVQAAVDACLKQTFAHARREYEPERDLVYVPPNTCDEDKYPEMHRGLPVWAKCEVNRRFVRDHLPRDRSYQVQVNREARTVEIRFQSVEEALWERTHSPLEPFPHPGAGFPRRRNPMQRPGPPRPPQARVPGPSAFPQPPASSPPPGVPPFRGPGFQGSDFGGPTSQRPPEPEWPPMPPGFPGWPRNPRTYGPGLARFLARARLADAMGVPRETLFDEHPYAYANNNPTSFVDPDGRRPVKPGGAGAKPPESCFWAECHNTGGPHRTICTQPACAGQSRCKGYHHRGPWAGKPGIVRDDTPRVGAGNYACTWHSGDCAKICKCLSEETSEFNKRNYNVISNSCYDFIAEFRDCLEGPARP